MIARVIVFTLALLMGSAAADRQRVAVVGDPVLANAVQRAISVKVELVPIKRSNTAPAILATRHHLAAVIVLAIVGNRATAVLRGSDGAVIAEHEIKGPRRGLS
nr:hypothetical protein [Deltaproteobacteria bacterium]